MTIPVLYELFLQYNGISTDTRKIKPGELFFALKGETFNGNIFAEQAIKSGASYVITDDLKLQHKQFIHVEDVLKTLQELSVYHRKQFSIPVIGITGTNGKTTTKELINKVLSQKYKTISTSGNLNNHIGVPLTILSIKKETEIAIIEMGANHPGEIDFLCNLARPNFGLITNIGKAHLEGFGSIDGIIQTKTELYRYLRKHHGTVFINLDNELLVNHVHGIKQITYGLNNKSCVFASGIQSDPFLYMTLATNDHETNIKSQLFGQYNAENIIAAACVGFHFEIDPAQIKSAIESYLPSNNRSQIIQLGQNQLILDAYNANPSSMEQAITGFAKNWSGEKVLILGDMMELGSESDYEHQHLLTIINNLGFNDVYLIGPIFTRNNTKREWHCFHDSRLASLWFEHHPFMEKIIFIKGSRSMKMEVLVNVIT